MHQEKGKTAKHRLEIEQLLSDEDKLLNFCGSEQKLHHREIL